MISAKFLARGPQERYSKTKIYLTPINISRRENEWACVFIGPLAVLFK